MMARIPKVLHRVLVGGYDPGTESHRWWERFGEMHPGWELRTWTDPVNPENYELGRLFASCGHGAQLADLLRIELLWRHGGIYVDSDVEPLSPLDPLLGQRCFVGTMDGWQITNAVVGCEPKHPAMRVLMDRLLEFETLPPLPVNQVTGPYLYTRVWSDRDDITILPRECLYPNRPWIEEGRSGSTAHSFCEHHWAGSWTDDAADSRVHSFVRLAKGQVQVLKSTALRAGRSGYRSLAEAPRKRLIGSIRSGRHLIENEDGFVSICALLCGDRLHLSDLTRDDRATLAALDRTLRPGDWCIVIGAGDGITAVAASRRTGNFGRVISHEPDLGKAQLLLENAAMNDAQGVQVLDVLSPSNAPLDLAGVAVPLRLAVVMPGHLNSDTLAFLRRVVDAAKVDYMLLPVLRSKDDSEWASTLGFMEYAAQRPCATLDSLDRRGRPTPITPIEIRVAERVDHLLIRFAA